jgi:hypothetical protein
VSLKEELGRLKAKSISQLMDIANRWAYGEDHVKTSWAHSPDDEDANPRYSPGHMRRRDHRRKRKNHGYQEADRMEIMVAGFADKCDDNNRISRYRGSSY